MRAAGGKLLFDVDGIAPGGGFGWGVVAGPDDGVGGLGVGKGTIEVGEVDEGGRGFGLLVDALEDGDEAGAAAAFEWGGVGGEGGVEVVEGVAFEFAVEAGVAAEDEDFFGAAVEHDGAHFGEEFVEFIVADGAGGIDGEDDAAHAGDVEGGEDEAALGVAAVGAGPGVVVFGGAGEEGAEDFFPGEFGGR
ncbi:hypothetical protein CCP3SC15_5840002 [Gammaproteobacteria bacterium]